VLEEIGLCATDIEDLLTTGAADHALAASRRHETAQRDQLKI
jgi:hypothetical protein